MYIPLLIYIDDTHSLSMYILYICTGVMITLFSEGNQTVEEGTGYLNICIAVSGRREVPITFELFSEEGTATGKCSQQTALKLTISHCMSCVSRQLTSLQTPKNC